MSKPPLLKGDSHIELFGSSYPHSTILHCTPWWLQLPYKVSAGLHVAFLWFLRMEMPSCLNPRTVQVDGTLHIFSYAFLGSDSSLCTNVGMDGILDIFCHCLTCSYSIKVSKRAILLHNSKGWHLHYSTGG